jgi:spermidine synthase
MAEVKTDSRIPEGASGPYRVEHFTVSKEDADMTRIRAFRDRYSYVPPGDYTRLMRDDTVVMSDTPMELSTNSQIIRAAQGRVLLNGLGIGMVLQRILAKSEVEHVTVVEISEDVIKLVGPSFATDPRVTIVRADALEYAPPVGERFDAVWHDIWDDVCSDNLPDMRKLHRRYGKRTGWQASWRREDCEYQDRQWKAQERAWRAYA